MVPDFVGKYKMSIGKRRKESSLCRREVYTRQGGNDDLVQRKQPIWTGGSRQRMYVGDNKGGAFYGGHIEHLRFQTGKTL